MKIEGMIEYTKKFTFPTQSGRPPQCKLLILALSKGLCLHPCLVFSLSSPHPIMVNPVKSSGRKDWGTCRSSAEVRGFSSALTLVLIVCVDLVSTVCIDLHLGASISTSVMRQRFRKNDSPWQGMQKNDSCYYCSKWLFLFPFYS